MITNRSRNHHLTSRAPVAISTACFAGITKSANEARRRASFLQKFTTFDIILQTRYTSQLQNSSYLGRIVEQDVMDVLFIGQKCRESIYDIVQFIRPVED